MKRPQLARFPAIRRYDPAVSGCAMGARRAMLMMGIKRSWVSRQVELGRRPS
jgi:hypothetical protein